MSDLKIYNSLTRKKETFKPQDPNRAAKGEPTGSSLAGSGPRHGRVTMYVCGPTVYGPSHVGHARTYIGFDFLKRVLEFNGYTVKHVLNITDVHDDMIKEAQKQKISISELARRYIKRFYLDLEELNIEPPSIFPRVTEHIGEIIQMVEKLVKRSFAYEREGSVYFDVSKFRDYGKLSGVKLGKAKTGTRVATDKYEKEEAVDFALWKKAEAGEERVEAVWDSPWGKGRPGWHIECSVMSKIHLGETLDIHGGALDLKFPHHENEIAQSEAANDKKFVNYWVHSGLLTVEGQPMSKSLGNFTNFDAVAERGFNPLALRYLFLTAHYRSTMNFTWAALEAAQHALDKLYNELSTWESPEKTGCVEYEKKFQDLINDDLNLPKAVALMWSLVKDQQLPTAAKMTTILKMDEIFGFRLVEVEELEIPQEVRKLVEERERLRGEESWIEADKVRDQLEQVGYRVEDEDGGPVVRKLRG